MKSLFYVKQKLGVSAQTVRNYIKQGKLKAARHPNGRFYVEEKDLLNYLQKNVDSQGNQLEETQCWAFYLRSSEGNKTLLNNQEKILRENYPEPCYVFKESASGLNENRPKLKRLIEKIKKGEITDVAITQKDRLARFGVKFLEELFAAYQVRLHILFEKENDETKDDLQQELLKDFMSLIASFSGRFYRLRSKENKLKLLEQAKKQLQQEL